MKLFHHPACPFSRRVRVVCGEKQFALTLDESEDWTQERAGLLQNPAVQTPMLWEETTQLVGANAICEWLEETIAEPNLLGDTPTQRAEVRRMVEWLDTRFYDEVGVLVAQEKIRKHPPDMRRVKAGLKNLRGHLEYLMTLLGQRHWLAGEVFSLADIAAGAHLSCLDYVGDIAWAQYPVLKEWYARLKSRPSFRVLLQDHLSGLPASGHYRQLDF